VPGDGELSGGVLGDRGVVVFDRRKINAGEDGADEDCREHEAAIALVNDALRSPDEWLLSDQVLFEFYAGLRHPRVFAKPLSAAEAARRELWEETGITADQLVELGWYYRVPGVSNQKTFFFIAPVSDAALDSAPHAPLTDDIVAQRAVNLTDCLDMAQTGLIRDVAVHLACLKLQAWLNQQ
jgi:8-oxo-dGTP pyrophosphatase MutT (NUDIX family)